MNIPNHPIGTIFAVYTYNGYRVFRVRFPEELKLPDVYVNDDMVPVVVLDTNDLHTIQVRIEGVLQSPWVGC
jgi:hypothetical protein